MTDIITEFDLKKATAALVFKKEIKKLQKSEPEFKDLTEGQLSGLMVIDSLDGLDGFSLSKAFKGIRKSVKKAGSSLGKVIKKVAPVALAGAALVYGGPYVVKGAKFLGKAALSKAKGAILNRRPSPQIQNMNSPQLIDKAMPMAQNMLQHEGFNMQSAEAKNLMSMFLKFNQQGAVAASQGQSQELEQLRKEKEEREKELLMFKRMEAAIKPEKSQLEKMLPVLAPLIAVMALR